MNDRPTSAKDKRDSASTEGDFGCQLSLYALHSAEALLRNYFAQDETRVQKLRDDMIECAVRGECAYEFDLASILNTDAVDSDKTHSITAETFRQRFSQLSKYLCSELLQCSSESLSATRDEKRPFVLVFSWRSHKTSSIHEPKPPSKQQHREHLESDDDVETKHFPQSLHSMRRPSLKTSLLGKHQDSASDFIDLNHELPTRYNSRTENKNDALGGRKCCDTEFF